MVNAIIDQITRLVGQAYLVSAVMPWCIFWSANILTGALILGPSVFYRTAIAPLAKDTSTAAITSVLVLVLLLTGGQLVVTFNGLFKRILEGRFLGPPLDVLMEWRVRRKAAACRRLDDAVRKALERSVEASRARRDSTDSLMAAYKAGSANLRPDDAFEKKVRKLHILLDPQATIEKLAEARISLLELYSQYHPSTCDQQHTMLLRLLEEHEGRTQAWHSELVVLRAQSFGEGRRPAPTDFGNVLDAANYYVADRYGMESLVFWSRLQPLIPKEYLSIVEQGKVAMDFLTAMTLLSLVYAVSWLAALPHMSADWKVLVGIVGGGCVAAALFYRASVEAALGFGETLKTSFDLYRRKLFDALELPRPMTMKTEKQLWTAVSQYLLYGDIREDLKFTPQSPAPVATTSAPAKSTASPPAVAVPPAPAQWSG